MGKTQLKAVSAYLSSERFELLEKLAKQSRIPRSELMREAVELLLAKHGMVKPPS